MVVTVAQLLFVHCIGALNKVFCKRKENFLILVILTMILDSSSFSVASASAFCALSGLAQS